MVVNPNFTLKKMKRSISEIPVTISAFNIGIFVIPIINVLAPFLRLVMAIAAMVPIKVDISADKTANIMVVTSASIMDESDKSFEYHSNVKPPHLDLDFDLLKDKTISTAMGA